MWDCSWGDSDAKLGFKFDCGCWWTKERLAFSIVRIKFLSVKMWLLFLLSFCLALCGDFCGVVSVEVGSLLFVENELLAIKLLIKSKLIMSWMVLRRWICKCLLTNEVPLLIIFGVKWAVLADEVEVGDGVAWNDADWIALLDDKSWHEPLWSINGFFFFFLIEQNV